MEYMNKYIVNLTSQFNRELQNLYDYIAFSLKEYNSANRFYFKIRNSALNLEIFPERNTRLYDVQYNNKNIRKLPVDNYIIIYEVDTDTRTSIYFTYFSRQSRLYKPIIILVIKI